MWFSKDDTRTEKRIKGDEKEKIAEIFLSSKGLVLIERNFNSKVGEIDLIMKDGEYLVFIEVRYRDNKEFGGALASITPNKQRKFHKAAELYLIKNFGGSPPPCRIDAIGMEAENEIEWIKNAF